MSHHPLHQSGLVSVIANSLLVQNSAPDGSAFAGYGTKFINDTIAGNSGPAISMHSISLIPPRIPGQASTITNSIVANNSGGNCRRKKPGAPLLIEGSNIAYPADGSCPSGFYIADPQLDSLFVPLPMSPAFGAGDNKVCETTPIDAKDFFGLPRPQASRCTLGAVEGELDEIVYRRRWLKREVPGGWDWAKLFGKSCCL